MSGEAPLRLSATAVDEARRALSAGDRFFYTPRNLYYEMVRRGAVAAPEGDPDQAIAGFGNALAMHETDHGQLSMLVRPSQVALDTPGIETKEVLDFAVPRIMVFDRADLFLLFAANGFHRRIEMALVLWPVTMGGGPPYPPAQPAFPSYVWQSVLAQLRAGITTSFHVIHDGDQRGYRLSETVSAALAEHGAPETADLGLTFSQAQKLGVPVRSPGGKLPPWRGFESESVELLGWGAYAHIEEMPPLELLRWAYGQVSKGHEEIGFG